MATKNALMIDPHTGQPVEWTQAQGPSLSVNGIDPKMMALYQQAGLWKPEYANAVGDWGTDPSGRAQARQQWQQSPEYQQLQQSLEGWTQGQARQDYNVADMLQSPDGQQYEAISQNKGPSFHSDDYRNMATVILGGLGTAYTMGDLAAAGAAGSGGGAVNAYGAGSGWGGDTLSAMGVSGGAAPSTFGAAGAGELATSGAGSTVGGSSSFQMDPNMIGGGGGTGGLGGASGGSSGFQLDPNSFGGSAFKAGGGSAGTSLADFFSGNGSTNDYLRAGQALFGLYSQNKAVGAAQDGNNAALAQYQRMYDQNRADNQPLLDLRNSVLPQINSLLKDPSSITQDPGYQFGLKQGTNQLNNRAAASGNYYSGQQMKAAQQYGQDYAGTKLDQSLNRLMGVATGTQVGGQNNQANNNQFAVAGGNALQQGGNIRAGGYLGQFNTVNNGVNNYLQDQFDRKYWGGGGG